MSRGRRRCPMEVNLDAAVADLAGQIRERNHSGSDEQKFFLIGLYTRGLTLAKRLADALGLEPEDSVGGLDVSLYRDDFDIRGLDMPRLQTSDMPFDLDEQHVILVDEVLFTGRTIRAALDGIMDYGRPSKIELAVLIDRGHRELPIAADYIGRTLKSEKTDYVRVNFREDDGHDSLTMEKQIKS